jgi:dGTP triphosphohydrolase
VQCLAELFEYYLSSTKSMPAFYEEMAHIDPRHVIVCDYIAGMTDHFLLRQHDHVFGPGASAGVKNIPA